MNAPKHMGSIIHTVWAPFLPH
uniref:Uncharacterized protein n=1 Tax=Anguilla anguilla TaxID=7936 RepID=A0A0E9SCH5_ANGAN